MDVRETGREVEIDFTSGRCEIQHLPTFGLSSSMNLKAFSSLRPSAQDMSAITLPSFAIRAPHPSMYLHFLCSNVDSRYLAGSRRDVGTASEKSL